MSLILIQFTFCFWGSWKFEDIDGLIKDLENLAVYLLIASLKFQDMRYLPSPLSLTPTNAWGGWLFTYCSWIWSLAVAVWPVSLQLTDFVAVTLWACDGVMLCLWLCVLSAMAVRLWCCEAVMLCRWLYVLWLWGCEAVSVTLCAMAVRLWGCAAFSVCYGCEPVRLLCCVRWQRCV